MTYIMDRIGRNAFIQQTAKEIETLGHSIKKYIFAADWAKTSINPFQ
jgi:hypothetical protein